MIVCLSIRYRWWLRMVKRGIRVRLDEMRFGIEA